MLSVGDLRNRIMALADETNRGNPELYRLFTTRFPVDADPVALGRRLESMISGDDHLVAEVHQPMQQVVRTHLRLFVERMPPSFDLRAASVGNLVLAGGYLNNERNIDSVIFLFSKLIEARGIVQPTADADVHLAAELADGQVVVGQHRLTATQGPVSESEIKRLYLVKALTQPEETEVAMTPQVQTRIDEASLIVYPMGSFFTSVIANLLPRGVGCSIAKARCPKVYVPNVGRDNEQGRLTVADRVRTILEYVRRDAGAHIPAEDILDLVLLDRETEHYGDLGDLDSLRSLGIVVAQLDLGADQSSRLCPHRLADTLISLG
jgi:CofD-related protein of GAK system